MAKTDWQMDDTVMPSDLNQIGQEINELQADGSTNDDRIGERTIDDTVAPTTNTGKLTSLLGWLAFMIKSITGGATWRTAPGMSLAAIKTILDAATNAATANALIRRDENGRAKVAAPSATDDIARKAEVDAAITTAATDATSKANVAQAAAISTAATDATTKANAVQSNLTTHAADAVKHITAAERTTWNAKANKDGTLQADLNAELWGGWKRYSSLSSLGLDQYNPIDDIFAALPVNGILEYQNFSSALPLYPARNSMVKFTKVSSTRMYGVFIHRNGSEVRELHSTYDSGESEYWSGWKRVAFSDALLQTGLNADMVDGYNLNQDVRTTAKPTFAQITSSAADGTPPLVVTSQTVVTNLNADMVRSFVPSVTSFGLSLVTRDAYGDIYVNKAHFGHSTVPFTVVGSETVVNLNADMVDGMHVSPINAASTIVSRNSSGNIEANRFVSTVATGTAPIVVSSTTVVTNLNADLLDGQHGSYYASKDFVFNIVDSRGAFGTTTGTALAFLLNFSVPPEAYYSGMTVAARLHTDTGAIPTLNINGLGPKAMYSSDGVARFTGVAGRIYRFIYDGSSFVNV